MANLEDVVRFCDELTGRKNWIDYPGAKNGLQVENNGKVNRLGASVDASLEVFNVCRDESIDFLISHHGLFWGPIVPVVGANRLKIKTMLDANIALYSSHLPLDAHPEIGNNAILASKLDLEITGEFGDFEGQFIGKVAEQATSFETLCEKLLFLFPDTTALNHGPAEIQKIGILSGGGASTIPEAAAKGIDTLITGEASQHHFAQSQELGINLFLCGHYATEVFGVQALAGRVAQEFGLESQFIATDCPL